MKFRVLSDLHVDINGYYPLEIPKSSRDVFTVLCGDTSGCPELTIDWIGKNVKRGVFVSGNHLPYCNYEIPFSGKKRTMNELRSALSNAFPADNDMTYLDAETPVVKKIVDGVMFLGSCCYTNMRISHADWNPDGDPEINRMCSEYNMNDYRCGYTEIQNNTAKRMTAKDYETWFANAVSRFDAELTENEKSKNPLPVVLITHHSLIPVFLSHNFYIRDVRHIMFTQEFNWSSYASDYCEWLRSHSSIKCYCCGHIHAVKKPWRNFKINGKDGNDILVVNNARGYVSCQHDSDFNIDTFVDTDTWSVSNSAL